MTNPFIVRVNNGSVWWTMSAMLAILGFLLTLAWVTNDVRKSRLFVADPEQAARLRAGTLEYQKLQEEVQRLLKENTRFQEALSKQSGQAKLLNESLQACKAFAGLTELAGPGVEVTLRDNPKVRLDMPLAENVVHDNDVLRMVNELWNAGAEAIAINNHRVVTGTSIRCVGAPILVNNVQIASPIVIKAIGDAKTIMGALNMPGGIVHELKDSGGAEMVSIAPVKQMRLPAYSGSTSKKFATLPKEAK